MAMVAGVGAHSYAEREHDFYATPPEAVHSLLAIEGKWLPGGTIWEPACGDGAIARVLSAAGRNVISTDIVDRGYPGASVMSIFDADERYRFPAIITNPPFKLAREFVDVALERAPYVAMLLRLAFLEGGARKPWFARVPLARVHVASRRLPMMHRHGWAGKKADSAVCYAWFVWDKRHEGRPVVQWFDWREHAAVNDNSPAGDIARVA
jgi:hypothetical protein